jgi:hypothetical protein
MGADAPIPPNTINVAAPEGTPPRRSEFGFIDKKKFLIINIY